MAERDWQTAWGDGQRLRKPCPSRAVPSVRERGGWLTWSRGVVLSSGSMSDGNGHDPATKQMVEVLLRMEAGIERLNAQVDVLTSQVGGLTARVDMLTARVDVLHDDMLGLRADVTGIRNDLRSLRPELRDDLARMQERVARLEAAVFKPAAE
jgi:outer membrane murein-binding lipoprotein Lpp